MTSVFDYPDFGRFDQMVADPLINTSTFVPVALTTTFGPFFVAPYESLEFVVDELSNARTINMLVMFATDQAFTQVVGAFAYWGDVIRIVDAIAVQGAWVEFQVTLNAIPATLQCLVVPRRGYTPGARILPGTPIIQQSAVAVGAGVTVNQDCNLVTTGLAALTIFTTAIVWTAVLNQFDSIGLKGVVAALTNTEHGFGGTITILLPPRRVQLAFTNNDAAGKVFSSSLVPTNA